jgi:hypothetical protein
VTNPSGDSEISDLLRDPCRDQNTVLGRTVPKSEFFAYNTHRGQRPLPMTVLENKMHICKDVRIYVFRSTTSKAKRRLTIQVNNPCGFYMQGQAN